MMRTWMFLSAVLVCVLCSTALAQDSATEVLRKWREAQAKKNTPPAASQPEAQQNRRQPSGDGSSSRPADPPKESGGNTNRQQRVSTQGGAAAGTGQSAKADNNPFFKQDGVIALAGFTTSYLDFGLSGGFVSVNGWHTLDEVRPKGVLYESFRVTYGVTLVRGQINFPKWEVGLVTPTVGFSYLATANLGKNHNDLMFMIGGSVGYGFQIGPNADPKRQDVAFTLSLDLFLPNAVLFDGWRPVPHLSCTATFTPMDERWRITPAFEVMMFFNKDVGLLWRMFEATIEQKPSPYDVGQLTLSSTPMFAFPSVFGPMGKGPILLAMVSFGWTWDYHNNQNGYTWTIGLGVLF